MDIDLGRQYEEEPQSRLEASGGSSSYCLFPWLDFIVIFQQWIEDDS